MSNWAHLTLDELCNFEKGTTGLASAVAGEYPLVATGAERRSCDTFQFDTAAVCIPLVSSTGHGHASLNHVHYQEGKFALGTILVALIPKDTNVLNAQFLHLYLSRLKDIILVPLMTGAANISLSVSKIKQVKIPLPSISEQLKVVSLFNRMDNEQSELSDEISTQQKLLKKLRQSILQEAIEGKLTAQWRRENRDIEPAFKSLEKIRAEKERLIKEKKLKNKKELSEINNEDTLFHVPDYWSWCRLDDIVGLYNGSVRRGPFGSAITKDMFVPKGNNTYKVYEQKNAIQKDAFLGQYYISEKHFLSLKSFEVKAGDIIISCAGTIGETYILPSDIQAGIINQALLKIGLNNHMVLNEYFIHLFSALTKKKVNDDATGSAMKNMVSLDYIRANVLFPIPPIEEQVAILHKINELFKVCDDLEDQISSSKINTDRLMQAVLKEAFAQ